MTWSQGLEIVSNLVQTAAILVGLWLTVVSWRKSYELTIRAQNENFKNVIWDRAGAELFMMIETYEKWLHEMIEAIDFFIVTDPSDSRFREKGQTWETAFFEILQKTTSPSSKYEEWRNRVEYYKPALIDIQESEIKDVFDRHGEIIETISAFIASKDAGTFNRNAAITQLEPLSTLLAGQGAMVSQFKEDVHAYCMRKTFFVERVLI